MPSQVPVIQAKTKKKNEKESPSLLLSLLL